MDYGSDMFIKIIHFAEHNGNKKKKRKIVKTKRMLCNKIDKNIVLNHQQ